MSNLGGYQILMTLAKRVGEPKNFLALGMVGRHVVFRTFEAGAKKTIKTIKVGLSKNSDTHKYRIKTFNVTSDGTYYNGLSFEIGEQYNVLEADGELY